MRIVDYKTSRYNINKIDFRALPKKYQVVDEYLIRGPRPNIYDIHLLRKEGVNKIFDLRHEGVRGFKWLERLGCKVAKIEYIRKPCSFFEEDSPTQSEYEVISKEVFINGKNGGKSLVHCNSGTHRTALMAAFYDITKGQPLEICKRENPNFAVIVQKAVEKHIMGQNYFSRNKVITNTKNPFIKARNVFNNIVEEAINRAYKNFINMMQK